MGRPVPIRAGVGASGPAKGELLTAKLLPIDASRGLSSGQTIGAVRTVVRPTCCLPELRVANRLRRLCPLGTRFPSFPPVPFGSPPKAIEHSMGLQALLPRRSRRVMPHWGRGGCACGRTKGLSSGQPPARPALPCLPESSSQPLHHPPSYPYKKHGKPTSLRESPAFFFLCFYPRQGWSCNCS